VSEACDIWKKGGAEMAVILRGENTYLVRVYLGRDVVTKKRIEINRTVHGSLITAEKVEAKLKGEKASGHLIKTPRMTLNALLDLYRESSRHSQAPSTREKDRAYFDCYVRPYIGDTPLEKINRGVIQQLFNLLLDKKKGQVTENEGMQMSGGRGLAPITVKNIRKVLRAAFNYALNEKIIAYNPVHKTKLPPVIASSANCLTPEEVKAFVRVKDEFWYGNAFVFQLHTGLRPQELMALVWEDVDFEKGSVRIERACIWVRGVFLGFGPPKGKRSERVIGLAPEHLELLRVHLEKQREVVGEREREGRPYGEPRIKEWALRKHPQQSHLYASAELIFPRRDGTVPNDGGPRAEFKVMLRRAGIQSGLTNYRWYDLRHTQATHLLILGAPGHEVAARMGHSSQMLQTTYAHVLKDRRSEAASLFVKHFPVHCEPTEPPAEEGVDMDSSSRGDKWASGMQPSLPFMTQ
jgi:integrase